MKIFHTADWHLGKLVQGVSMTEDQRFVLQEFVEIIRKEKPDVVIIAGDLYDRAIPPHEAVQLLNDVLDEIVIALQIPVIAIAGNHDSPSRLHFGSKLMRKKGFYIVGQLEKEYEPVILADEAGEVHFHLIPYSDPSIIRHIFEDDTIKTYDDATKAIIDHIKTKMDSNARHVFVGHAFVTPYGEAEENTSESERPLSIGGAEYVSAQHFEDFHYVALGHLHQAHHVGKEHIRYAGSPLKYSQSEEHHKKGFYLIELDGAGNTDIEKRELTARRDIRTVTAKMEDILDMPRDEDYVFVQLLDKTPILSPMEKVRSVFPNAMHVTRAADQLVITMEEGERQARTKLSDVELFEAFYKEVKGFNCEKETLHEFQAVLEKLLDIENESITLENKRVQI